MKISASFIQMVLARYREFRREPSAFFFVIFMPVLWMLILGVAFSEKKPEVFGIGVLTDESQETVKKNPMFQSIQKNDGVKLLIGDQTQQDKFLKRGQVSVILEWKDDNLVYKYDPKNPNSIRARHFINSIIQEHFGRKDPIAPEDRMITVVGSRYIDFLVPGLLALSILTTSLFGTGMTIVSNRRENLLKLYMTTPMKPYEYILSHITGRYIIFAFEIVTVMLTAYVFFGFSVSGNFFSFLIFAMVGTAVFTSLGILIGSKTRNTIVFSGIVNITTVALMMLGGVWFSRDGFPGWLYGISEFLPLTALVDGLRLIALEGAGIIQVLPQLGLLIVYGIVSAVTARKLFKWY